MKKFLSQKLLFLAMAAFLPLIPLSCSLQDSAPELFPKGILGELPENPELSFEEFQLENGLRVLFVEDREFPLVDLRLYIPGGSLWEPTTMRGVYAALGAQMREGGAGKLGPDELDRFLEDKAAELSSSFGEEFGEFGLNALAQDFEDVLPVFADMIFSPQFDASRLSLWKTHALESIRRREDNPSTIAGLTLRKLLYGDGPYGRILSKLDIEQIDRESLQALHAQSLHADHAIMVIHGAISRSQVEKSIRQHFGAWQKSGQAERPAPEIEHQVSPGIYFIERPLQQATIHIAQRGVPRLSDDYLSIAVFNEIFGSGGFGTLLMDRVREELGLAYSVYGSIMPGVKEGMNLIGLQTKNESAAQAIEESLLVLQRTQEDALPQSSIDEAKNGIIQSRVFTFDAAFKILRRKAYLRLLHYPVDFDDTYIPGIQKVSQNDILRTARRRWDINKMVVIVVGNAQAKEGLVRKVSGEQKGSLLRGMKLIDAQFDELPQLPNQ